LTADGWYRGRVRTGFPGKSGLIGHDWLLARRRAARHDGRLQRNSGSLIEADLGGDPGDLTDAAGLSASLATATRM
jgi:hypothetical protein